MHLEYSYRAMKARDLVKRASSIGKKVEDIPPHLLRLPVQFGVSALGAGNGNETLVLHIKDLGKIATRSLEAIALIVSATAFGTHILFLFHRGEHSTQLGRKKVRKTLLTKVERLAIVQELLWRHSSVGRANGSYPFGQGSESLCR